MLVRGQGDQIGRISAIWLFAYSVYYKNLSKYIAKTFGLNFFSEKLLILRKKWVGQQFGRFFTKLSGHAVRGSNFLFFYYYSPTCPGCK
jgi:hypothetical protein